MSPLSIEVLAGGAQPRRYSCGDLILLAGQGMGWSYLFAAGSACIFRYSENGGEATLGVLGAGDVIPATSEEDFLVALQQGTVAYRVPRRRLFQEAENHPGLWQELTDYLSARLVGANDAVADFCLHDVCVRLAHRLTRLAGKDHECLRFTREELGCMVRASRQEVTGALKRLRERGWIWYDDHRPREIWVENVEALENVERELANVR
jgi:CRP-like cAMP-binding protein